MANFFREIGLMDRLGSGVRNVTRYIEPYANRTAEFVEGDIFKTVIPIPVYQAIATPGENKGENVPVNRDDFTINFTANFTANFTINKDSRRRLSQILVDIQQGLRRTAPDWARQLDVTERTIRNDVKLLRTEGWITFKGPLKNGHYELTETGQQLVRPLKTN